jgi:methionine-rich copper-binding protein CopC
MNPVRRPSPPRRLRAFAPSATLPVLLLAVPVAADHPVRATPPAGGIPLLAWVFGAGLVVLVGLVAWAVFAPGRDDDDEPAAGPGRHPGAGALAWVAVTLAAATAAAHATGQRFEPRQGATLSASPPEVRIGYDGAIEPRFSTIEVAGPDGRPVATGAAEVDPESQRVLRVRLPALDPGVYTVRWRVLAVDGHRTEGRYTFTVKPR